MIPAGKKILIASDHAGFPLKEHIKKKFNFYQWKDLGVFEDSTSVDYPDYASRLSSILNQNHSTGTLETYFFGVLVCKSGQGMAMVANKFPFIRAAVCWSKESAQLSREHNDANLLCLSESLIPYSASEEILNIFLRTSFLGGRHQRRLEKIKNLNLKTKSMKNHK